MNALPARGRRVSHSVRRRLVALAMLMGVIGSLAWASVAGGTPSSEKYDALIVRDEPVAWFRVGDPAGSSTIEDAVSAHTYTAANSGVVLGGNGPFSGSGSGSFASGAYASLPANPLSGATAFTLEGWVYWGGGSYGQPVFAMGSSASDYMSLTPASSGTGHPLSFEIVSPSGSAAVNAAAALPTGAWSYVVVSEVAAGSSYTLSLSVNGAKPATTKKVSVTPSSLGQVSARYLGRPISGEVSFAGRLSNIAFYTKALTEAQVKEHYAALAPVDIEAPSVPGSPREGVTSAGREGTWSGLEPFTFAFQWQDCRGGVCENIKRATTSSYTPSAEQVESTLKLIVTASDGAGEQTVTSPQSTPVEGKPANAVLPTITGEAADGQEAKVGEQLNVSEGSWRAFPRPSSFGYTWEACKGKKCSSATGSSDLPSYRVNEAVVGKTLRATVTATNTLGEGSAASAATATVVPGPPVSTAPPTISGYAAESQTLTGGPGSWAGSETITYKYQWQLCNHAGQACSNIPGATSSSIKPEPSDVEKTLRIAVQASNSVGSQSASSEPTAVVVSGLGTSLEIDGAAPSAPVAFSEPGDVAVDSHGNVWVLDTGDDRVEKLNEEGKLVTEFGSEGSGNGQLKRPSALALDPKGDVWVADTGNDRVEEFSEAGVYLKQLGSSGSGQLQLNQPEGIAIGPHENVWVSDTGNSRVQVFSNEGGYLKAVGAAGAGQLTEPEGLAVARGGDVWVADFAKSTVEEFSESGEYLTSVGSEGTGAGQLKNPFGVAIDAAGNLWVGDVSNDRIEEFGAHGEYVRQFGTPGKEAGRFNLGIPMGLAIDGQGRVWVADSGNDRVDRWAPASAPSNASAPTILGSPQEGELVSASVGSWTGTPPLTYRYQWQRCNPSGEECAAISGATSATHAVTATDVGSTLRVAVTVTNGAGEASLTSAATATVTAAALAYYRAFYSLEEPLSFSDFYPGPTDVMVDPNGNLWALYENYNGAIEFNQAMEPIGSVGEIELFGKPGLEPSQEPGGPLSMAIDSAGNIWLPGAEVGRVDEYTSKGAFVRVIGEPGSEGSFRKAEGIAVGRNGDVWVSGEGVFGETKLEAFSGDGQYLKTVTTHLGGDFTGDIAIDSEGHMWVVDSGDNDVVEFNEAGEYIKAFGSHGSGPGQFDYSMGGIAADGHGHLWVVDGNNERVQEFNDSGEYIGQFGTYGSGPGQLGFGVGSGVAADAAGDVWVADTENTRLDEWTPHTSPTVITTPAITGTDTAGETLIATDGTWTGLPPFTYSFQWQRCKAIAECENIENATGSSYTVANADVGHTVRVAVTASDTLGAASSNAPATLTVTVARAPENTSAPTIDGATEDGQTLSAQVGAWAGTSPTYGYQWESCNQSGSECAPIENATGAEYQLGPGDIGSALRVVVTATNAAGSARATSATAAVVHAEPPGELEAPSISGTPDVHQVLYAAPGAWAGSGLRLSYQWESCSESGTECAPIEGATAPEYDLAEGDLATTLRIRIGAAGATGSLSDVSAATMPIGAPGALANTSAPSLTGTPETGQALAVTDGRWTDSLPISGYSYQWQACDRSGEHCEDIEGATSASYQPGEGQLGARIRAEVTASDEKQSSTRHTPVTQPIAAAQAPLNERAPAISGTALQGQTLTATNGAWLSEGTVTYSYQWQRCAPGGECLPIEGATANSHTAGPADIGSTLLVLVTASAGNASSTALSAATATIEPETLVELAPPSVAGGVQSEGTLNAEPGIWSGVGPLTNAYEWLSCNVNGSDCTPISGAGEAHYTISAAERGSTLRATVTVKGPLASKSATSPPTVVVPDGELSVEQAEQVAQQTDPDVLAQSTSAMIEQQSIAPALADGSEGLSSQHALTSSSISKEISGEFAVNTPAGELSLTPVDTAADASADPTIVNGAAALFANTSPATDTIVRPEPLGATTILQLRSKEAPTSFSWQLRLGPDQQLEQLPGGSVAVINAPESTEPPNSHQPRAGTPEPTTPAPETPGEKEEREQEERHSDEVEAKGETEREVPLEPLPAAYLSSTNAAETIAGMPQPQNTQAEYEAGNTAMAKAEAQTGGQALMVIQSPTVTDSEGNAIPAALSVTGDSTVTLSIKPPDSAVFPLVAATAIAAPTDKVSAERDPVHYGLADESPGSFAPFDHNLETGPLEVHKARLIIAYDALERLVQVRETALVKAKLEEMTERERLERWLAAVEANPHLEPFITFGPDRHCSTHKCEIPDEEEYRARISEIITSKYADGIGMWGAWNEPDGSKEPLNKHAALAAEYWQIAQQVASNHCGCTVVAGEFAFQGGFRGSRGYVSEYRNAIIHNHCHYCSRARPTIWGFHDYLDVVTDTHTTANEFVAFTGGRVGKGRLWITEAGVELQNGTIKTSLLNGSPGVQQKLQRQSALDFETLHEAAPSRIDRVYYYSDRAPSESKQQEGEDETPQKWPFDSGLLEAEPEPSPPENKRKSEGGFRAAYCLLAFKSQRCPAPTVETGNVLPAAETLRLTGKVNPNGSDSEYRFEWGPTTAYGSTTEWQGTRGPKPLTVTYERHGICPIHYRLAARNEGGITYGLDHTAGACEGGG